MKNVLEKLQNKAGYISIETIIVAGLMIGLGVYAMNEFYAITKITTDTSMDKVNSVLGVTIS